MVSEHEAFSPEGSEGAARVALVRAKTADSSAGKQAAGSRASASAEDMALETEVATRGWRRCRWGGGARPPGGGCL